MSTVLEVAIGVVFMYLLLALMTATVQELIATVWDFRAQTLYAAIKGMLQDPTLSSDVDAKVSLTSDQANVEPLIELLYKHPLITNLGRPKGSFLKRCPSYIPSKTFAVALLDVLSGHKEATDALGMRDVLVGARATINNITNNEGLKRALFLLTEKVEEEADKLDEQAARISNNIETWFNDRMARVSGWYKREAQLISLLLAALATVISNADTINVVERLWQDGARRAAVVAVAQAYHSQNSGTPGKLPASLEELASTAITQADTLQTSGLPIGWGFLKNFGTEDSADAGTGKTSKASETQTGPSFDAGHGSDSGASSPPSPPNGAGKGEAASTNKADEPAWWVTVLLSALAFFLKLVGLLITTLAVSLGAGFWFDILGKVLQLRGTGAKISALSGRAVIRDP